MTTASNLDGAPGLGRKVGCVCRRRGDGIRGVSAMRAGVQAHHWSRLLLLLYMGLLAPSVKGKSPPLPIFRAEDIQMQQACPRLHHPPSPSPD
ncbi:hypothetical protein FQA47_001937 [Oryzias melastigma]|uniref:Uncharacterized protein n=1 Tax=Oryzias melastigma TaxID=30732 RepID=A0A834CER0_ORYME|nr:hypothetical protein FQA47_001937 [Oryzias melastigma]